MQMKLRLYYPLGWMSEIVDLLTANDVNCEKAIFGIKTDKRKNLEDENIAFVDFEVPKKMRLK